jgi:hypothetical protein
LQKNNTSQTLNIYIYIYIIYFYYFVSFKTKEALKIRQLRLPDSEKVAVTHEKIGSLARAIGKAKKAQIAFEGNLIKLRICIHSFVLPVKQLTNTLMFVYPPFIPFCTSFILFHWSLLSSATSHYWLILSSARMIITIYMTSNI